MTKRMTCPSVTGDPKHEPQIIGFIEANGRVANIPTPIPLTDAMRAAAGPQPERMFRLAGPCRESRCVQWRDAACSLIGRMQETVDRLQLAPDTLASLPRCAIRGTCRWWAQAGPEACRACAHVIYNPGTTAGSATGGVG
ncbi:hypothetical protein CKO45_14155 [Paracraurococcus ruber]|uniref:Nitrogen fixation protein n=2 Tax=Paracraurococcus ruber TaxID=77675 RepID=A0ABS1CY90_9PROT|nr:hypothetical protein [Paracraurococcus ruber]